MFDLKKTYSTDHFFFSLTDNLLQVCNAPTNRSGVYLVYALSKGRFELVYIGLSGKRAPGGDIHTRKAGCGGIKDRIVNGKHFNRQARRHSWPAQMRLEGIEALDVYWFVTYHERHQAYPEDVERELLARHFDLFGRPPIWQKLV